MPPFFQSCKSYSVSNARPFLNHVPCIMSIIYSFNTLKNIYICAACSCYLGLHEKLHEKCVETPIFNTLYNVSLPTKTKRINSKDPFCSYLPSAPILVDLKVLKLPKASNLQTSKEHQNLSNFPVLDQTVIIFIAKASMVAISFLQRHLSGKPSFLPHGSAPSCF